MLICMILINYLKQKDTSMSRFTVKQPKIDLDKKSMNPILNKLINKMDTESFMIDEKNVLVRLEEYKKRKM